MRNRTGCALTLAVFCAVALLTEILPWPAEKQQYATNIGQNLPNYFEPSGCAYLNGYLYVCGDGGHLAKISLSGSVQYVLEVRGPGLVEPDLEGVAAGSESNMIYLGVECKSDANEPAIIRWSLDANEPNRIWALPAMYDGNCPDCNDNTQLETLAILPNEDCDLITNYHGGAGSVFEGSPGLFLAGHQGNGKIYIFDLNPNDSNDVVLVGTRGPFGPNSNRRDLSGLDYHAGTHKLYAIWDDPNEPNDGNEPNVPATQAVFARIDRDIETVEETWWVHYDPNDLSVDPGLSDNEEGIVVLACGDAGSQIIITEDPAEYHDVWYYEQFTLLCTIPPDPNTNGPEH